MIVFIVLFNIYDHSNCAFHRPSFFSVHLSIVRSNRPRVARTKFQRTLSLLETTYCSELGSARLFGAQKLWFRKSVRTIRIPKKNLPETKTNERLTYLLTVLRGSGWLRRTPDMPRPTPFCRDGYSRALSLVFVAESTTCVCRDTRCACSHGWAERVGKKK